MNTSQNEEVQRLEFVISMELNTVADNLKTDFPTPNILNYDSVYSYVSDKIVGCDFICSCDFLTFENGFNEKINKTPNKESFVESEILSVSQYIEACQSGIKDKDRVYNEILGLVLNVSEKKEVLKMYFNRYLLEGDYSSFVYTLFCFDLTKYLMFLKGDKIARMLDENKAIKAMGINAVFLPLQLKFIFDEMVKLRHFKPTQEKHFFNTFEGMVLPGTKLLSWMGSKSLIRYFMQQLTGQDKIKIKEINQYIKPPIGGNDRHTGRSHYPIKIIFEKARTMK